MQTKQTILQLVAQYQQHYPLERTTLQPLLMFLNTTKDDIQLYDRNNFNGHITASAFILNDTLDALLLLNHKKLNRWLQPGGHVDVTDQSILQAALREAIEETGILKENLQLLSAHTDESIFDIDSHLIPANINKNESAHLHHDIRFVFKCLQPGIVNMNINEAMGFKWVPLKALRADKTFTVVAEKLIQYL